MRIIEERTGGRCLASFRISPCRAACPPRMRWRSTSTRQAPKRRAAIDRRPAPAAHRQFRRSRSLAARARRHGRLRPARRADAGRCRAGHPARLQGDHRRSAALREQGWDIDIRAHLRRGGRVLGICGGYQMLGRRIHDPEGLEGPPATVEGSGAARCRNDARPVKALARINARHVSSNTEINGYEIHLGRTKGEDCARPFAFVGKGPDGAISPDGRVEGTYLHGCFRAIPSARPI